MSISPEPTDLAMKVYDYLFQLRKQDVDLKWTRVSLILAAQGVLFSFVAGSYDRWKGVLWLGLLMIELFGVFLAGNLYYLLQSSDFWVEFWTSKLRGVEESALGGLSIIRFLPARDSPEYHVFGKMKGFARASMHVRLIAQASIAVWAGRIVLTLFFRG